VFALHLVSHHSVLLFVLTSFEGRVMEPIDLVLELGNHPRVPA